MFGTHVVGGRPDTTAEAQQADEGELGSGAPSDLRTEYADNPLGIEADRPRFSWQVGSPRRNRTQHAYRIVVGSSLNQLDADEADVWDSGRVESHRSVNVEYDGPSLESHTNYYWK